MFKPIQAKTRSRNVFSYICNLCGSRFHIIGIQYSLQICLLIQFVAVFILIMTYAIHSSLDIFPSPLGSPAHGNDHMCNVKFDSCTNHIVDYIRKNPEYAYVSEITGRTLFQYDGSKLSSFVSVIHYKNAYIGEIIDVNDKDALKICNFDLKEMNMLNIIFRSYSPSWWIEHHVKKLKNRKQKTIGEVENAVAYCQFYPMFGHNFHDFFAALMFLPEDVIKQGFVVMPPPKYGERMQELFDILGFKAKILLDLKRGEQLFARNFYYIHPCAHVHCYTIGGLPRIKELIEKTFNITKIDSKRFVVMNRDKESGRRWNNSEKLHEALIKNVAVDEGYSWELRETKIDSWVETIKYWRTIKILVSPSGSHIYNALFMAPHTGMCLEFPYERDDPNIQLAMCSKIFLVGVHNLKLYHGLDQFISDIEKMCKYTQKIINCVNKGYWDDKTDLVEGFWEKPIGYEKKPFCGGFLNEKQNYKETLLLL